MFKNIKTLNLVYFVEKSTNCNTVAAVVSCCSLCFPHPSVLYLRRCMVRRYKLPQQREAGGPAACTRLQRIGTYGDSVPAAPTAETGGLHEPSAPVDLVTHCQRRTPKRRRGGGWWELQECAGASWSHLSFTWSLCLPFVWSFFSCFLVNPLVHAFVIVLFGFFSFWSSAIFQFFWLFTSAFWLSLTLCFIFFNFFLFYLFFQTVEELY